MSAPTPNGAALLERLRLALSSRVADAEWQRRARWLRARVLIGAGADSLLLDIDAGGLSVEHQLPPLACWDFALRATPLAWTRFWEAPPPPGWHDLLALAKRGELRLEGSLEPFMRHLQLFKDLLAAPRPEPIR